MFCYLTQCTSVSSIETIRQQRGPKRELDQTAIQLNVDVYLYSKPLGSDVSQNNLACRWTLISISDTIEQYRLIDAAPLYIHVYPLYTDWFYGYDPIIHGFSPLYVGLNSL